jgi:hypothetical protein
MLDLNELDQLKITGTPEIVTVDFSKMLRIVYRSIRGNEAATRSN